MGKVDARASTGRDEGVIGCACCICVDLVLFPREPLCNKSRN